MAICHTEGMGQRLLILGFSACLLPLSFAQIQPGQLPPKPVPSADEINPDLPTHSDISVTTNVVIAPTTVIDKSGDYVNGLQLKDFTLYDNGKPQKITADVSYAPISLVIAVQATSNLKDILPKIQRDGLVLDNAVVGDNGEVAVVAFDHRIRVMQDFTTDPGKVEVAMKSITPGSSSSRLIDAVEESVRMLRRRPTDRRRVLLLIAEKRDRSSEAKLREALEQAQFANVAIYSIDISSLVAGLTSRAIPQPPPPIPPTAQAMPPGAAVTPTTVEQNYYMGNWVPLFVDIFKSVKSVFVDDTLDVFTRFTGGKEYAFVSQKDLEKVSTALGAELHSQYLLSYTPNNSTEGGFHDIKVVVDRPNLEVRTRPGYWVAPKPE